MIIHVGGTKRLDRGITGVDFVDVCLLQNVTLSSVNQAVMEGNLLLG